MASSQNKTSKKQRTPRVVSNPKVVNRTGGRKPQPREITSPWRVLSIRLAVRRHAMTFLQLKGMEIPSGSLRESYFKGLLGLHEDMFLFELDEKAILAEKPEYIPAIQEAFAYGHQLVADAPLIGMPGAHMPFFGQAVAKLEQNRTDSQQNRRKPQARKNKSQSHFTKALVASGHGSTSRSNVANRVAKATIKSA